MSSLPGFLTTIVLLGAVQGLIASILLFFSARNRRPNRFLAWFLLLTALACFNLYSNHQDWYGSGLLRFWGVLIPTMIIMPLGPLAWFYVNASLDPDLTLPRKKRLHFLPVMLDLVPSLTALIFVVGVLTLTLKNEPAPWGIFIDSYDMYVDIPRWLSLTIYLVLAYRLLAGNKTNKNYKWLRQFTIVLLIFQGLWLVYLIPYVIPRYSNHLLDAVDWYPLYVPLSVMIYWLGIRGYMISFQTAVSVKKTNSISNSLTGEAIDEAVARLKKSMEEENVYLNPELSLQLLSQHTGLPQKIISAVLNQHIHKSFNVFVNEYRIKAFKEKIVQADMENFTMAGIAAECGFNSQATFQRSFKEITGMSPSEFRKAGL